MSELMDELKANLEASNKNLEKLVSDIQGMSDAESEFSELRDNLGEAAQALSRNSEKYEAFLVELKESNVKFSDTLNTLKSLEPKEIRDRLDDVKEISDQTKSISEQNSQDTEKVVNLLQNQSEAIANLEKRLNSKTALIPVIFMSIIALAGVIIGQILGLI